MGEIHHINRHQEDAANFIQSHFSSESKNEQQTITYDNMPSNIRSITATISAEGQTERVSNFRNVECDGENEVALSSGERDSHRHLYEQQEAELREKDVLIQENLIRFSTFL